MSKENLTDPTIAAWRREDKLLAKIRGLRVLHKPLTEEEIKKMAERWEFGDKNSPNWGFAWLDFARNIELAHGIKE